MKRMRAFPHLLLLLLLAACTPQPLPESATVSPSRETAAPPTSAASPSSGHGCYYNWATQPLPDLTAQIQKRMNDTGLKGVTVSAEAYGENCYDNNTNQAVSFASLETDIQVTAQVANIQDTDALGKLLEQILGLLEGFPAQSLSAGHLGYIGITFQAGETNLRLWFTDQNARTALGHGYHGAALVDALRKK